MQVLIRKFEKKDIPGKVKWINDLENNQFLHYDLPLEVGKTKKWFDNNKDRTDRYDAIIEVDGVPCGTIGLLDIDPQNSKAEYYIAMGEVRFKSKGIATKASKLILDYAFCNLKLYQVYLYIEIENLIAQHLVEKVGFKKKDITMQNRFVYTIYQNDYLKGE